MLTDDQLARLLKACSGKTFENRRDTAIRRFLLDTGVRVGEMAGMSTEDLDFDLDVGRVLGKGRRERAVPFGAKTGEALRRYLRLRSHHPKAANPALWIGPNGRLTDSGVRQMLQRRGIDAGIADAHPHRFRHSFAHDWPAGGQETDLMRPALQRLQDR